MLLFYYDPQEAYAAGFEQGKQLKPSSRTLYTDKQILDYIENQRDDLVAIHGITDEATWRTFRAVYKRGLKAGLAARR